MISPQNLKIAVLFTLLLTTFIFTVIPLGLRACILHVHDVGRRRRMKASISLLNCFTAGVFLGTCLLDLFPDVREEVDKTFKEAHIETEFPVTEIIVLFGFFLLLSIEQFVTRWKATHEHSHIEFHTHQDFNGTPRPTTFENSYGSMDSCTNIPPAPVLNEQTPLNSEAHNNPMLEDEAEPEENAEPAPDPSRHSVIRPLMLLTALSLHSIFEGLAIGLQATIDHILQIFLALTLHKCIVAFSIGMNNVQSHFPIRIIFGLDLFFSLMSPIGIALGIGIENLSSPFTTTAVTAVLQGIACGTFLYVVFMEILPHEFMAKRNHPDRMLKVLCCLIGIAVVVGILLLDP